MYIDSDFFCSRDTKHNLYAIVHDKKRLIRTSSKHMTYIPQNCYPYQQYSPFYPTTEQFLPEGVGTGMNMI